MTPDHRAMLARVKALALAAMVAGTAKPLAVASAAGPVGRRPVAGTESSSPVPSDGDGALTEAEVARLPGVSPAFLASLDRLCRAVVKGPPPDWAGWRGNAACAQARSRPAGPYCG